MWETRKKSHEKINKENFILGRNNNNNTNTLHIEDNSSNDVENTVNNNSSNSNNNRKTFVSVTAECHASGNVSFVLHLHTSEPFQGWFYARDHQVRNPCLVESGIYNNLTYFVQQTYLKIIKINWT